MLNYLTKRWFLMLTVLGIVVATASPDAANQLFGPLQVRYVAGIVLFFMSIGLATSKILEAIRDPRPALLALTISFGVGPILAYLAAQFLVPPEYAIGLIVAGSVPCSLASATIWTRLAGGNESVALLVTIASNVLVFVFTAGWLSALTGQGVALNFLQMATGLLLYVVLPIAVGQLLRMRAPFAAFVDDKKRLIGVICRALILLIIIKAAVDTKIGLARHHGTWGVEDLFLVALVCIGIHLAMLSVGYTIARPLFSREDAIAVAFSGSQKTLPVGAYLIAEYYQDYPLAIVPMLFFHVGQLLVDTYIAESFFYSVTPETVPPPTDDLDDQEPLADT